jgi:hypothetical protein
VVPQLAIKLSPGAAKNANDPIFIRKDALNYEHTVYREKCLIGNYLFQLPNRILSYFYTWGGGGSNMFYSYQGSPKLIEFGRH